MGLAVRPATVLSQMQEVGLAATEFGPDDFLPDEPQAKAKTLADKGLRGWYVLEQDTILAEAPMCVPASST
jgi:hypothetical protein